MSTIARLPFDIVEQEPLARHTSLRVGGPARRYLASSDVTALARALDAAVQDQSPILVLGGGSNLLVADDGFDGLVIRYAQDGHRVEVESDGTLLVWTAAGTNMSNLARRLAHEGVGSLEWAASVPGTIGGAVVNNAGAFGGCMADHLVDCEIAGPDGAVRNLVADDLAYGYRTSRLKRGEFGPVVVRSARLRARPEKADIAMAKIVANQNQRTASQPRQLSAGSIFANPPGDYAGRLIEATGLKGARRGGAEISAQHANFIVNTGSATADDVVGLMCLAQDAVWQQFGLRLQTEVQLVGAWDPDLVSRLTGAQECDRT